MRFSRVAAVGGGGAFAAAMTVLHVLRPDVSPLARGMSRYAGADTLWLATAGFLSLAVAVIGLRHVLRGVPETSTPLAVAATGVLLVVLTPIGDPPGSWLVDAGHTMGALAFYWGVTRVMFKTSSDPRDRWIPRAMIAALSVFFLGAVGTPILSPIRGLLQRLVFVVVLYWIARVAYRSRRDT